VTTEEELKLLREFVVNHSHLVHAPRKVPPYIMTECEVCAFASDLWHSVHGVEEYMEPDKTSPAFAPDTESTQ